MSHVCPSYVAQLE